MASVEHAHRTTRFTAAIARRSSPLNRRLSSSALILRSHSLSVTSAVTLCIPAIFKTPQLDVLLGNVLCSYLAPGADGLHRRVNGRQCGKRQTLGFLFCTSPSLLYPRVRCSDVHKVPDNTRFYFCAVNECM